MYNIHSKYENTIIYKITCKDTSIKDSYVGHTTDFRQRYTKHKSTCNNVNSASYNIKLYKTIRENGDWNNWEMNIIEKYPCKNVEEAKERERFWIEKEGCSLNMQIPYKTKEEKEISMLIYNAINEEKISFQKKQWYEENKQEILEKAKDNYQENKEHKLEYQKQYAEQHKDKIKEQQKIYREKNAAILSEQKKNYRENHKEEISKLHRPERKMRQKCNKNILLNFI